MEAAAKLLSKPNKNSNALDYKQLILRANKEDTAFLYFILEANEGISFYSTLEELPGGNLRDVVVTYPILLEKEFLIMLNSLRKDINIIIIEN